MVAQLCEHWWYGRSASWVPRVLPSDCTEAMEGASAVPVIERLMLW